MLKVEHVSYRYPNGERDVLQDVCCTLEDGQLSAIVGPSGSGKTTLLSILAGLDSPSVGSVSIDGEDYKSLDLDRCRRERIAMIFQAFHLFPLLNVVENVCFAMELNGVAKSKAVGPAKELLEMVGIGEEKHKRYPAHLSGGEQQRVAIARALATNPKVLLCDEATSALDPKTTRQILELIRDINRQLGITVVVITHQMSVVKEICTHVAILDDGEVVEDGMVSTVFSAPRSQAARHLVFPGGADAAVSDPSQERRIRLIFRSAQTTAIPMVARLAAEESIYANVISASTQKLSEEIYGSMLLGVPRGQLDRAMGFFRSIPNLQAEEVSVDVH